MDEILFIANKYFWTTENPKYYITPHNPFSFIFVFLAAMFFFVSIYYYSDYGQLRGRELYKSTAFIVVLTSELSGSAFLILSQLKKQRLLVSEHFVKDKNKTTKDVKIKLINEYFQASQDEYKKIAYEIMHIQESIKKYKKPFELTFDSFFSKIYNNEEKSRVITLIALLFSVIAALFISSGAKIDDIFIFYKGITFYYFIIGYFFILTFIWLAIIMAYGILHFTSNVFFYFFLSIDKENSTDTRTVNYLLRDLLRYSTIIQKKA